MDKPTNSFLERQLQKFPTLRDDSHAQFLALVGETYDDHERTRRRLERAMSLMNDELQEQMQKQEKLVGSLQERTAQFEATLHSIHQGLVLVDAQGRILIGNDRFAEMLGYGSFDQLKQKTLDDCFASAPAFESPAERDPSLHQQELNHFSESQGPVVLHARTTDNRTLELEKIRNTDEGYVVAVQDITESVISQRLEHLVNHDSLTGLASRHAFNCAIEEAKQSLLLGERMTLLCMDLDRFKSVNDTLGHAYGDDLLKQVAARVSKEAPESAIVARLGGDEFAILIQSMESETETIEFVEAMISAIRQPFEVQDQIVRTGVSVGIAHSPQHGRDAGLLLKRADIALYRAKSVGGNAYRVFSHAMEANFAERTRLEKDLKSAVSNDELRLHYQPIVCAQTQKVRGFEALVRWQHPSEGLIPPDRFIPLAEETGLINSIGRWVLNAAIAEASKWPEQYSISVNLSGMQFLNRHLVTEVSEVLAQSGFDAERLHLEITETVLMDRSEFTKSILDGLRAIGVHIHLDDFGAGYSSFNYVLEFAFQRVKIDKVFLQNKYDQRKAHAILSAISSFCRDLGIETVVEGVETKTHLDMLKDIEVDALQGYFFSHPVEAKEARLMMEWNKDHPDNARVA